MKYYRIKVGYEISVAVKDDEAPSFDEGYFVDEVCDTLNIHVWKNRPKQGIVVMDENTTAEVIDPIYEVDEMTEDFDFIKRVYY